MDVWVYGIFYYISSVIHINPLFIIEYCSRNQSEFCWGVKLSMVMSLWYSCVQLGKLPVKEEIALAKNWDTWERSTLLWGPLYWVAIIVLCCRHNQPSSRFAIFQLFIETNAHLDLGESAIICFCHTDFWWLAMSVIRMTTSLLDSSSRCQHHDIFWFPFGQ